MPASREPHAWARGLGRHTLQATLIGAAVLVLVVALLVTRMGGTPPVNAAVYSDESWGMDALLPATLVIEPDCITVEAGGVTYLPIFARSSVRLEGDTLRYAGVVYRSGDQIELAGGGVDQAPADARIPPGCPTASLWRVSP